MGSAGMLALLPLTPKLLFLGYEGDVYSVPNERGFAEIKNPRDAIAFNRHQFLQCVANVYVHDANRQSMLIKHYSEIESARPTSRHVVHYAQIDCVIDGNARYAVVSPEDRDKTKEAIMHSRMIHPHPGIWPSQIQIRKNGSVCARGAGMGYVRLSRALAESEWGFWSERA